MSEVSEPKRDRVSIDASWHDLYKKLAGGDRSPFKTMKDLFLTAACIGYRLKKRQPLARRQQIFAWSIFSPQDDIPIIRALAIATTGDVKILLDQNEMLNIVEEYANGGIGTIEGKLAEAPGEPLLKLAEAVVSGIR